MLEKIKNIIGKFIGFLIIVGIIVAIVSIIAIFGGALMKLFGFTYQSVGSIILFFVVSGILGFPIELFVKAIPKVLFSHLFNDEFYEDSSILVSCEVIKIEDIERMELVEDEKMA